MFGHNLILLSPDYSIFDIYTLLSLLTNVFITFIAIDETQRERNSRAHEQVHPLKNFCQLKKPNVSFRLQQIDIDSKIPLL